MRKGNTYSLTRTVTEKLRALGDIDIEEIFVSDLDLPFCTSCHVCFDKGEQYCPHRSVMEPIAKGLEDSDALIVSGTVYSLHINAAMKNLIDHLSYYFHRPRLFEKKGLIITTTAGAGDKKIADYLRSVLGHWGVGYISSLSCKIRTVPFSLTDKQKIQVEKTAKSFYEAIVKNKYTAPTLESVAVHNSFRGMNSGKKIISQCDNEFWLNSVFSNKSYPRRINPFKSAIGSLAYRIISKVINKSVKIEK